jgi:hypothetical protein
MFILILSQAFHHFSSQLDLVSLVIQHHKCAIWFPSGLPSRFLLPLGFYIPIGGIRVLGVPLGSFSFTFFFLQDPLNDDVQHIYAFLRLGNVVSHGL